jgi:hypothetical protein
MAESEFANLLNQHREAPVATMIALSSSKRLIHCLGAMAREPRPLFTTDHNPPVHDSH